MWYAFLASLLWHFWHNYSCRNETLGIETLTLRITDDEKEEFSKLGKNEGGSNNQDVTKILEKLCKTAMCAISNIWDTDASLVVLLYWFTYPIN